MALLTGLKAAHVSGNATQSKRTQSASGIAIDLWTCLPYRYGSIKMRMYSERWCIGVYTCVWVCILKGIRVNLFSALAMHRPVHRWVTRFGILSHVEHIFSWAAWLSTNVRIPSLAMRRPLVSVWHVAVNKPSRTGRSYAKPRPIFHCASWVIRM